MKNDRQKGFVKTQCAILDRFDDRNLRHLMMDLLCLMDREGRVRMDYTAIADRLGWPSDELIPLMDELRKPDPKSNCQKYQGACVAYIDPNRPKAGFLIPAAVAHRKANALNQARRDYKTRKMREYRAKKRGQRVDKRGHRVDNGGLPLPSTVDTCGQSVDNGGQPVDCEGDRDREYISDSKSGVVSVPLKAEEPSVPQKDQLWNVSEIVTLLCEKIYDGKIRPNQVSQETLHILVEKLPFSRDQIELVGDYFSLPADDCWPELKKRRLVSFDQLIRFWGDHLAMAIQFDQKYFA